MFPQGTARDKVVAFHNPGKGLSKNRMYWHLDPGRPASRAVRSKHLLFQPVVFCSYSSWSYKTGCLLGEQEQHLKEILNTPQKATNSFSHVTETESSQWRLSSIMPPGPFVSLQVKPGEAVV